MRPPDETTRRRAECAPGDAVAVRRDRMPARTRPTSVSPCSSCGARGTDGDQQCRFEDGVIPTARVRFRGPRVAWAVAPGCAGAPGSVGDAHGPVAGSADRAPYRVHRQGPFVSGVQGAVRGIRNLLVLRPVCRYLPLVAAWWTAGEDWDRTDEGTRSAGRWLSPIGSGVFTSGAFSRAGRGRSAG